MTDSPVPVPVVYVGNDDIPRHIKAPKLKKAAQKATSKLSAKFVECAIDEQPKKPKKGKPGSPDEDSLPNPVLIASNALLESGDNLGGTNVYSFKTPKRSKQMNKFAESVRKKQEEAHTENAGDQQKKNDATSAVVTRTQYALQVNKEDSSGSDSDASSDSSEDEIIPENGTNQNTGRNHQPGGLLLPSERELYFDTHGGKKGKKQLAKTSDHTLQKLKNPQLNPDQLSSALQKHSNEAQNVKEIQEIVTARTALCERHQQMFSKWFFYLCNNFNIMLYGLGSKRQLIHTFCTKYLSKQSKLVVNGFFPSLSIKSILMSICEDILMGAVSFSNLELQTQQICLHYSTEDKSDRLFLIIHNIDGMCLRSSRTQAILSQLAFCPRIHILASIDHINAPLVWDQTMLSRFNWLWYDVTTFATYREETSYEGSLLLSGAGSGLGARGAALALSGLLHVARSLTSNARGVFRILAEHQIDLEEGKGVDNEDAVNEDLSFSELYQKCRERFLVNSELTLRAHLTEFLDHKLVQMRKGADGGEYLSVPLDLGTLKEYLEKDESK